ncbi:MAG: glycosyltransferase [Flavobacteriales bacterium]|nr:glycosyltransferase [Flavobacteriales bacterium]
MAKRILIAPLDWGLGHATRCIPLIRHILELGHEPVIAAEGRPLALLREEFPDQEFIHFRGYEISYPEGRGMVWKMGVAAPRIIRRIEEEHHELQAIIQQYRIDAVISDNRFGLYSDKVPCAYITHQVMIKAPFFEGFLHGLHRRYMERYTEVWVPDHATNGLSGDLGHKHPLPPTGRYIGPLSRFQSGDSDMVRDILVLISGPEPQRTRFENIVLKQLETFEGTAMAVLGTPEFKTERTDGRGHRIVPHLPAAQLEQAVRESRLVISRSGYSTIMDLSVLGKRAVFVPTPGQTEQEYLGKMFHASGQHLLMPQRHFDLGKAWADSKDFAGFAPRESHAYREHVERFVTSLS